MFGQACNSYLILVRVKLPDRVLPLRCHSCVARIATLVCTGCCAIYLASLAIWIGGIAIKRAFAAIASTSIVVSALVAISASYSARFRYSAIGAVSLSIYTVVMGFSIAIGMGNSPRVIAITFAVMSVGVGAVSRSGFAVGISCRCGAIA